MYGRTNERTGVDQFSLKHLVAGAYKMNGKMFDSVILKWYYSNCILAIKVIWYILRCCTSKIKTNNWEKKCKKAFNRTNKQTNEWAKIQSRGWPRYTWYTNICFKNCNESPKRYTNTSIIKMTETYNVFVSSKMSNVIIFQVLFCRELLKLHILETGDIIYRSKL